MDKRAWLCVGLVWLAAGCARPKTASSVLQDALTATGNVSAIQFSGTGMSAVAGQAVTAGQEWPRRDLTSFTAAINYDQHAARYDLKFAQPTFGGQQQNTEVNGDKAWTMADNGPTPQLAQAETRRLQILLTPHGFLKDAMAAGDAMLAQEANCTSTITYRALGKYTLKGTIDNQNMLTRIETTRPDNVLGDADVVATFSDYKDYNGVKFPNKIVIAEGGYPTWDLAVNSVIPNAKVDLPVPGPVQSATIPPVQTTTIKLGDGAWWIGGGTHHSVVVEFNDYIAVIEGPLSDERSAAVIAEAKKLAPNKPIRYVLTTHHHFDHTGGLRAYVAEGATVVTNQSNVAYFQKAFAAPATVMPDMLAKNPKPAQIQGVSDKWVLTDGKQTIEVYPNNGDTHTSEYDLIYLPKQRVLVEGDPFSPGPPDAPPPATPQPNAVKLNAEIQRLKLNVATIAPIHGRGPVPIAELKKFIGA
jgi:glyoxylase-like metal-dependent hydrolase (beta-lactamase superfamily II)